MHTSRSANMNSQEELNDSQNYRENIDPNNKESALSKIDHLSELSKHTITQLLDLGFSPEVEPDADPPSSELYMFDDDTDLLQALNEDPSWAAVAQSPTTKPTLTTENDTAEHSDQPKMNFHLEHTIMDVDNNFDLPELPAIPVITMESLRRSGCEPSTDATAFYGGDLFGTNSIPHIDTPSPIVIDSDIENEEAVAPSEIRNLPKHSSTSTAPDIFYQKMRSLDIDDKSVVLISSPNSPSSTALLSSRTNRHSTSPPAYAQPEQSGPRIVLRKRRAIQLKPFTLESAHFRKLISKAPAKSKLSDIGNIRPNIEDDENDIDFTPTDTQLVDEPTDEISSFPSIYDQPNSPPIQKRSITKRLNKKIPLQQTKASHPPAPQTRPSSHSLQANKSTVIPQPQPPASPLQSMTSSSRSLDKESAPISQLNTSSPSGISENVNYSQDLQKYGLNQLILPPSKKTKDKGKGKVITFASKKKGPRKKHSTSTSRIPSRFAELIAKDIFAFDPNPKASFTFQPTVSRGSVSNKPSKSNDFASTPLESNSSSPTAPFGDTISPPFMASDEDDEMDEDEELVFRRKRMKRKRYVEYDSDDEEEDDISDVEEEHVEQELLTEEQINAIYDFPSATKRHLRNAADINYDIVSVGNDKFEYREAKRQRMRIQDIKNNKRALKSVLPASYAKVFEKDILEEQQSRKKSRKSATTTKKVHSPSPSVSITSNIESCSPGSNGNHTARDTDDIFAAFRESQTDDSDNVFDEFDGYDNYNYRYNDTPIHSKPLNDRSEPAIPEHQNVPRSNNPIVQPTPSGPSIIHPQSRLAPIFQQSHHTTSPRTNVEPRPKNTVDLTSRRIPAPVNQSAYPLEAAENNRMSRHYVRSTVGGGNNNNRSTNSRPRARRPAVKSSVAIVKPTNTRVRNTNHIGIRNNPAPQRRRKRPKRSTDDIYVHAPYFTSHCNNRPRDGGNDRRMFFKENLPRRAFDDIYMGTKQQTAWYKSGSIYIGNYDINDYIFTSIEETQRQQNAPIVYSLQTVIKRVRGLFDHDLQRDTNIKNTVYLHHRLLQPLLSATPNKKSAYSQFKNNYSDLVLFGKLYSWKHIEPKKEYIIDYFFAKVFRDLLHMCTNDKHNPQPDMKNELPDHDHFYVFVSICLTQWLPCYSYEDQVQLAELFANRIRGLACMLPKLVETNSHKDLPWKSIVKLMVFVLDWTCRLHHLGIDRSIWSVTECTQLLMDMLVYIGYEDIKRGTKEYVIEAWICLIQIMSVSTRDGGYYFNEQVFLNQLTDSIKGKSRGSESYEFEKRKTTRLWAESLNLILDKYMML